MDCVVDNESLNAIHSNISNNKDEFLCNLRDIRSEMIKFRYLSFFSGNTATSILEYFDTVHLEIQRDLVKLLEVHIGNYELYYQDIRKIEPDMLGRIDLSELRSINSNLKRYKKAMECCDETITTILRTVSDLFTVLRHGCIDVSSMHKDMIDYISGVDGSIRLCDTFHSQNDFLNTTDAIANLKNLISECLNKERSFKFNFSPQSVREFVAWNDVKISSIAVADEYEQKKIIYEEAQKEAKYIEQQIKAYKRRERQVKKWKWVIWGTGVIITGLAIASGAGPLCFAVVGAVKSASEKMVDVIGQEYIEKGNLDNLDVNNLVKETAVSAVSGAATGAISRSIGIKTVGVESLVTNTVISTSEEMIKGGTERIITSVATNTESFIQGDCDFRTAIGNVAYDVFDPDAVKKDAINGLIEGGVSSISDVVVDKVGLKKYTDTKNVNVNKSGVYTVKSIKKGLEGEVSGIGQRFSESIIEDKASFSEAIDEAFDGEKMIKDGVSSTSKGWAKTYASYNKKDKNV